MPTVSIISAEVRANLTEAPNLKNLVEQLGLAPNDAFPVSTFLDNFHRLAESGEVANLLNRAVSKLAADSEYTPPTFLRGTCVIFQNSHYTLYVQTSRPNLKPEKSVVTMQSSSITAILNKNGCIDYRRWGLPAGCDISVFDPSIKLLELEQKSMHANDPIVVCEATNIVSLNPNRTIVLLKLVENASVPYQWAFSYPELQPLFIQASTPAMSRCQTVIELIRALSVDGALDNISRETLEKMTAHPLHFIRWKAIQALFSLDQSAGFMALKKAQNDDHPHLSRAARSSLKKLALAGTT